VTRVDETQQGVVVSTQEGSPLEARGLFVATCRHPATEGLCLDRANVQLDGVAVRVDRRQRTTAKRVWAAGDVTGGPQFTHAAEATAKAVLQNALFPVPTSVDPSTIPRVTFTDPEIAHIGISHQAASELDAKSYVYEFSDLDRAIVDADTRGMVKISADRKGRILAASVVGAQAGELIFPLVLAQKHGLTLSQISSTTFPYPTRMEGIKRAADAFQRSRLEGPGGRLLKMWVSWLS
jgi:pyruvate/2-oxoglutarate dehydrogenase complex dihydrolipoamide dehydrogenase (E3) component